MKRRTPMRRVSPKRSKQNRTYAKLREQFLAEHPWCEVALSRGRYVGASQVHHRAGRIGDKLNDTSMWMAVSQEGHDWIHSHGKEARVKGWLV